ncbi:MAG: hypothetical protein CL609_05555 [Anaerolineaceae bacterium]|nr:hypothetical protein [Anaerolineaceae bacterium]
MLSTPFRKQLFIRFLISLGISILFGAVISEGTFKLMAGDSGREPQVYEIVVPEGTTERVKQGLPVPSIPDSMVFYEGDSIIVVNQDVTSHQLGPIWVPAGASGKLSLDKPIQYNLACTFQPSNNLGLEVRSRLTAGIRIQGIIAIGIPSAVLLWLFSVVVFPIKGQNESLGSE